MRAYFFCVIFTQLFGSSNYYSYFCVKITHKMKDLKYYKVLVSDKTQKTHTC